MIFGMKHAHIPRFNQRPFQAPDSRSYLRPHTRVSPTKVFKSILYRKGLPCSIKIGGIKVKIGRPEKCIKLGKDVQLGAGTKALIRKVTTT